MTNIVFLMKMTTNIFESLYYILVGYILYVICETAYYLIQYAIILYSCNFYDVKCDLHYVHFDIKLMTLIETIFILAFLIIFKKEVSKKR